MRIDRINPKCVLPFTYHSLMGCGQTPQLWHTYTRNYLRTGNDAAEKTGYYQGHISRIFMSY